MQKHLLILMSTLLLTLYSYAQDITFKTLTTQKIEIQNLEGNFLFKDEAYTRKNILLFFFGVRCPYCIQELPDIEKLSAIYPDLKIIGIHGQFTITDTKLRKFVKEKGLTFPILDSKTSIQLVDYLKSRHMWIGSVPYHIMIDKHGNFEPVEFSEIGAKCTN